MCVYHQPNDIVEESRHIEYLTVVEANRNDLPLLLLVEHSPPSSLHFDRWRQTSRLLEGRTTAFTSERGREYWALTSIGDEYLQSSLLQKISSGKDRSNFAEMPFTVQIVHIRYDLDESKWGVAQERVSATWALTFLKFSSSSFVSNIMAFCVIANVPGRARVPQINRHGVAKRMGPEKSCSRSLSSTCDMSSSSWWFPRKFCVFCCCCSFDCFKRYSSWGRVPSVSPLFDEFEILSWCSEWYGFRIRRRRRRKSSSQGSSFQNRHELFR